MKLTELLKSEAQISTEPLSELSIKEKQTELIKLFTDEATPLNLHYENTEASMRGFFLCLDAGCPYCEAGEKSTKYLFLPVVSVTQNKIAVLRMSTQRGPHNLLPLLGKFLTDPDIAEIILSVQKTDQFHFAVEARKKPEYAEYGADLVADFLKKHQEGQIDIKSIVTTYSSEELRQVPRIRVKLNFEKDRPIEEGVAR